MGDISTYLDLRAYLRGDRQELNEEFEVFLYKVELFIRLRVKAEELHAKHQYYAKSRREALPLPWSNIAEILSPGLDMPEESLASLITRDCLAELMLIAEDLRKVLLRQRERVQLSRVQQIDVHCLRWLVRQPGRDALEKAGASQRIMAVVRRESFATLENRVLIDFVRRASGITCDYLARNAKFLDSFKIVRQVKRFYGLCLQLVQVPVLSELPNLTTVPHPNYVLRQERRYAKIWAAYCRVVRHATIAEQLWDKRIELDAVLANLKREMGNHISPYARYHSPLWFPRINGKNELVEKPFLKNEEQATAVSVALEQNYLVNESDFILDLDMPPRDLLIYSSRHPNAKPYLQNYIKPSIEDYEDGESFYLTDILQSQDYGKLADYFEQLKAIVQGDRWVILIPDDWDAQWQERVIQAVPLPRSKVLLLWRSVAIALGGINHLINPVENQTLAITDCQQAGIVFSSRLVLAKSPDGQSLIPQRKSFVRHRDNYKIQKASHIHIPERFARYTGSSSGELYLSPLIQNRCDIFNRNSVHTLRHTVSNGLARKGAMIFLARLDSGSVPYYDELEALYLVAQTEAETVKASVLVAHNERHPGGQSTEPITIKNAAMIDSDSKCIRFLLCMGEAESDAPLKEYRHEVDLQISGSVSLDMTTQVTPGQGMAVIDVTAEEWLRPLRLDFLNNMHASPDTIRSLENKMDRSFPPHTPAVRANDGLWRSLQSTVESYLAGEIDPDGKWFAKAALIYPGKELPAASLSPLEKLRRKNVFGNDPLHRYPSSSHLFKLFDYDKLFKHLAEDCQNSFTKEYQNVYGNRRYNELTRLIAWTYAYDFKGFVKIKDDIIRRYVRYSEESTSRAPETQELTLVANLCVKKEEWSKLFYAVLLRISNYKNKTSNDFYLLQNLLQFNPSILEDIGLCTSDSCWVWVQHFPYWFNKHKDGGGIAMNYILKSLLYFLRCRLHDGKSFLTEKNDADRRSVILQALEGRMHRNVIPTRNILIRYLNGLGRLDDIPMLIGDD